MPMSLKDQNKIPLAAITIGNLAILILLMHANPIQIADWATAGAALSRAVPAGVALILIGVLNAQLSSDMKARIVFGKWRYPLPGAEAFSRFAKADDRIDYSALEAQFGPFPTSPKEQSALWYKLYKTIGDDPSVRQVHREYLFTRDYACLALMLVLIFGPIGLMKIEPMSTALTYWGLLVLQFVLVVRASRNHGRRFVTTVLALKAAGR